MDMLVVEGGYPLSGTVKISGSKNASLPILIATLLSAEKSVIKNIPQLADARFLLKLLSSMGTHIDLGEESVAIHCPDVLDYRAHYDVVRKMRASVLVLAPLLARTGRAIVSLPGGCAIGTRPVDIHLDGLKKLGATIDVIDGYIHAELPHGHFIGNKYTLAMPSVGATENLIMAAVKAKGHTVLSNVAREPEVTELCEALQNAGARISGIGNSTLHIEGVDELGGIMHSVNPDRVEAGTFIALAAATASTFTLDGVIEDHLTSIVDRFIKSGVQFHFDRKDNSKVHSLTVTGPKHLYACDVETAAYPGFPTDMQAQFMAAMTVAQGVSTIYERIFENRMMHVPELRRMGAQIELKNGAAIVHGQKQLMGAPVMATDLRASASLVIASLIADGKTEIRRIYHLDRGYEALENKLTGLGARITRLRQEGE